MNVDAIRMLYNYNYWAFERVWECLTPLTDEQFIEDVGYSTGSIRNYIVHTMSATRRWIRRLQPVEEVPHLRFEDYPTRAITRTQWDLMKREVLEYVFTLDQAQLEEKFTWQLPGRNLSSENRRWELLMHVANHATDHRAQILATLHYRFGVTTVEQDMLFYLTKAS